MKLKIKIDGGSQPNPGESACGAVVYVDDSALPIYTSSRYLGSHVTNNVAEHEGLILALKAAISLGATQVTVETDSKVVANHFNGGWKVNHPQLQALTKREKALAAQIKKVKVEWVGRANVTPAHNIVQNELLYRKRLRSIKGVAQGKKRVHADVEKFILDNNVYIKQKTDFCFFTPNSAIVPLWECVGEDSMIYPMAPKAIERDIFLLNEEIPVILAWRPYGEGVGAKPPTKIPSTRPLKASWDGGTELMMGYADYYRDGLLLPSFAGKRRNNMMPAREMIWWSVNE